MTRLIVLTIFLTISFLGNAFGQASTYFAPHVIFGRDSNDTNWTTSIEIVNPSTIQTVNITIHTKTADGRPLRVLPNGPRLPSISEYSFELPPLGVRSVVVSSFPRGTGWALVETSSPVVASVVLREIRQPNSEVVSAVTVEMETVGRDFVFPFAAWSTGLALLNTSSLPASVTIELTGFNFSDQRTIALPPQTVVAKFIHEIFQGIPIAVDGKARIRSSQRLAISAINIEGSSWSATRPGIIPTP